MAGDWIKMRTSLLTNPKVNGIARELELRDDVGQALSTGFIGNMSGIVTRTVMRHVTVSSLLIVWGAANEHTKDGIFHNADLSDIDDMVGIPGFGCAMETVGWLVYDHDVNSISLPNFNEYNTSGAERSAHGKTGAQRQKEYRERKKSHETVTPSDVTGDVTSNHREDKIREEVNTPPDGVSTIVWKDFRTLRNKLKAPITETSLNGIRREAAKAGMSFESALRTSCERSWRGFKADWLDDAASNSAGRSANIVAGAI